eukprot:TRINITY_DN18506_c0_g1_i1.p1 TRINITY_DN18506_c0_g1~~TRINITY_DN18506_c0_g1_i1.p1  ORF type:complete len:609 (+),score=96.77 TRINITY_DN18506_c0_g1_i1:76-1902(+)
MLRAMLRHATLIFVVLCNCGAGLHLERGASNHTASGSGLSLKPGSWIAVRAGDHAAAPEEGHGHEGQEEHHGVLDSVHAMAKSIVMPLTGALIVCVLIGNWLRLHPVTAVIPDSAWTVLLSCALGFALRAVLDSGRLTSERMIIITAQFLNLFLLPVIIFESGWSLNHFNFMSQLEHISIFAVFGTLISFTFVGCVGTWLGQNGYHVVTSARENFVFAALISAVDPVATLATLSSLGLDRTQPLLHTMVFGESVVNDAVAIVLFVTINEGWNSLTVTGCAQDIAWLLFGSAGFGILMSALLILLMRLASLPGKSQPVVIFFVASSWFIYAAAEGHGFSGIIANLCGGSMFKMYGSKHLDEDGVEMATHFLHVLGHMCDTLVFILVGVASAFIDGVSGPYFAAFAILLCLVGRALSTLTCGVAANGLKTLNGDPPSHIITMRHQVMMWWGGLRGGIALVLVLQIHESWCTQKQTLVNATFLVIVASLLVLGSTTEAALKVTGFTGSAAPATEAADSGEAEKGGAIVAAHSGTADDAPKPDDESGLMGQLGKWNIKRQFYRGLNNFWMFVLVGDEENNLESRKRKLEFAKTRKVEAPPAQTLTWSAVDDL